MKSFLVLSLLVVMAGLTLWFVSEGRISPECISGPARMVKPECTTTVTR